MKFYLAEDSKRRLRAGSLEERLEAVQDALFRHHEGDPGQVQRKVLASFEDGAHVAEDTGAVYRYTLERLEGRLQVTRRDPVEWAELKTVSEEATKAVLEQRPVKVVPSPLKEDCAESYLSLIESILSTSPFLAWWDDHGNMVESTSWTIRPRYDGEKLSEGLRVLRKACRYDHPFQDEFTKLGFWASKLEPQLSEMTKSGESYRALIEYIKKIDTFTYLKFRE